MEQDQPPAVRTGGAEQVVKTGLANHWRGLESVGGRLTITATEVVFTPHRFNVQRAEARWRRSDIRSAAKGFSFNEIDVAMADGSVQRFVVRGRRKWLSVLAAA